MNYFSPEELACKHCLKAGKSVEESYHFNETFLSVLNSIRSDCGFPLPVSSGYRCSEHPVEAAKTASGAHTTGRAVDIAVSHEKAHRLIQVALQHGVPRIGVNQKGNSRFIHLDCAMELPHPTIWSY